MLAKDYIEPSETVHDFVMRVLRETITEQNSDELIDLMKISGFFGFIVKRGLDALIPDKLLDGIGLILSRVYFIK